MPKRDIFIILVLLVLVPAVKAGENIEPVRFKDIPYVENGTPRQCLDIVLPHDYRDRAPLPVIVYIHGGGWNKGDKSGYSKNPALLKQGYACVSINYRYLKDAFFPAQIQDCKAAVRWLRAHADRYRLDPDRIGVFGTSAGGHLAAMLGVTGDFGEFDVGDHLDRSSRVHAVCNAFGPSDLTLYAKTPGLLAASDRSLAPVLEKNRDILLSRAEQAGPIRYLRKGKTYPPFLILHGSRDLLVPVSLSIDFERKMKEVGGEVELSVVDGVGHGSGVLSAPGQFGKIIRFFDMHLKRPDSRK